MDPGLDAKQRYLELKKRLKYLLHENESYKQEIAKVDERLLSVSKDKAFLLEQLLQFEDNDSSTESELSDSDQDRKQPEPPKKKPRQRKSKAAATQVTSAQNATQGATQAATAAQVATGNSWSGSSKGHNRTNATNHGGSGHLKPAKSVASKRRSKQDGSARNHHVTQHKPQQPNSSRIPASDAPSRASMGQVSAPVSNRNTLTAEEVERHLLAKSVPRIQLPLPTPLTLPAELFNEDAFVTDMNSEPSNM